MLDLGDGGEAVNKGLIADRWPLVLPDFRVEFHAARPTWEIGRLASMAEHVTDGTVVYDIGAEHGDFTALYASWGAQVIPVEPAEAYWPCIRATFEANDLPPPPAWFAGFASDKTRRRPGDMGRKGWPPMSDGEMVADPGFRHLAQQRRMYAQITLSSLAAYEGPPDVVTIDVEGAEWHVLQGGLWLFRTRPVIVYVSVHEPTMKDWYGKTLIDLHGLMSGVGYAGRELPHHGEGETFWLYERAA